MFLTTIIPDPSNPKSKIDVILRTLQNTFSPLKRGDEQKLSTLFFRNAVVFLQKG